MIDLDGRPVQAHGFQFSRYLLPHVRIVVPLTVTTAVMLEAADKAPVRYGRVMREFHRTANRTIACNAHRFVFPGSELLLRRLVKATGIDQVDRPVRFYGGTEDWLRPDASQIAAITVEGF